MSFKLKSNVYNISKQKGNRSSIIQFPVNAFNTGLITAILPQDVPRGGTPNELNWMSFGDHIEIRRGTLLIGNLNTNNYPVIGMKVAHKWDGTEILFMASKESLYYLNEATQTFVEVGTNLFAGIPKDEQISFAEYKSLAGAQLWICSPSTGLFKIMTANPGDYSNMTIQNINWLGRIKIFQNRMLLWYRLVDKTSVYGSNRDAGFSYTPVQDQIGTGNGVQTTFSFTLTYRANNLTRTNFNNEVIGGIAATKNIAGITNAENSIWSVGAHGLVVGDKIYVTGVGGMTEVNDLVFTVTNIIDANTFNVGLDTLSYGTYTAGGTIQNSEVFTDDYLGNLKSNLGGIGTIDYTTGVLSVTFHTPPINLNQVLDNYEWEDSNMQGISDFTFSSVRTANQGFVERQDSTGGDLQTIQSYNQTYYCFHDRQLWAFSISEDDTTFTNEIFREVVGLPNWQAADSNGDGVWYVDNVGSTAPLFRLLSLAEYTTDVLPNEISLGKLDLSPYNFSQCQVYSQFDVFRIILCMSPGSTVNDTMIVYNTEFEVFDVLSYSGNFLDIKNNFLIAGDSLSPNVYQLFSGFTDNDAQVPNFFYTNIDDYGIQQLKRTKKVQFEGDISIAQAIQVSFIPDRGAEQIIGTINGDGSYVDGNSGFSIGFNIIGEVPIGGDNYSYPNGIIAYHYLMEMKFTTTKFLVRQLKFTAIGVGYCSISMFKDFDIRLKTIKLPVKYRTSGVF